MDRNRLWTENSLEIVSNTVHNWMDGITRTIEFRIHSFRDVIPAQPAIQDNVADGAHK